MSGYNDPSLSQLVIGLDFDETWTADPVLWQCFINLAIARNHTVVIVTGRKGLEGDVEEISQATKNKIPVVFAGSTPKRQAAEKQGFLVDIWIDDMPDMIEDPSLKILV